MLVVFTLATILLVVALCVLRLINKSSRNLPDGPNGFPVVGNLPQFLHNPHLQFSAWATQYGKIFTVHLGTQPVLVMNDVKTIKELLGTFESTGMFKSDLVELLYGGPWGITNSEGQLWQEQRRFCIKAMKEQGFGNGALLDPVIMNEVDELCNLIDCKIKSGDGENVHLIKLFMQATSNTIWNIVTGKNFKPGESQVFQILEKWVANLNRATTTGLAFLPWMKYIIPETCGYTAYYKSCQEFRHFVKMYFTTHMEARKTKKHNFDSSNLIAAYLEAVEECKDATSSFYGETGMNHGLGSALALLVAGTETTASTLTWLIFYLAANPNVQKKLQTELDTVIGNNRDPTLTDRSRMPYTDAVIAETLRCSSLAPFGNPHRLLSEINYKGYVLPKGMFLLANIYHLHHDSEIWNDPEEFQPERFLGKDNLVRKDLKENLISFQEGRRKCPGEQLARDTLFLFATKLFQKYNFFPLQDVNIESYTKPVKGILLTPPDLGVVVKHRI